MKLVLLPGMDGTGRLFEDMLENYPDDYLVIPLPQTGDQSYPQLARAISSQLPNENFVLLAESFSGGLVPHLLKTRNPYLSGIIFVASFISCPNRILLELVKFLPLQSLLTVPRTTSIYQKFMFDPDVTESTIQQFINVVANVPETTLKKRIHSLLEMDHEPLASDIPCIYIKPKGDKLVPSQRVEEIRQTFRNVGVLEIFGPHFILQARPEDSAKAIAKAVQVISRHHSNRTAAH